MYLAVYVCKYFHLFPSLVATNLLGYQMMRLVGPGVQESRLDLRVTNTMGSPNLEQIEYLASERNSRIEPTPLACRSTGPPTEVVLITPCLFKLKCNFD